MANPTEKWLTWENGKLLTLQELHQLTGLTIQRQTMVRRLKQARDKGYDVSTLSLQIGVLTNRQSTPVTQDENAIPLLQLSENHPLRRLRR